MSDDQNETTYGLVLSFEGLFDTMPEERAFVLGVEFNDIWRQMRDGKVSEIEATTHTENRAVIARAAAAEGWELEVKPSGTEGWDFTKLTKKTAARPNPHGLRVVG